MRAAEMDLIAEYITRVLASPDDDRVLQAVHAEVKQLCRKFPLYPDLSA
jgi:glycine/serine hydroxymethyltransferase